MGIGTETYKQHIHSSMNSARRSSNQNTSFKYTMRATLAFASSLPVSLAYHIPVQTAFTRPATTLFSALESGSTDINARPSIKTAVKTDFDSFDYNEQWYPVIWAVDVPLNEPVRVTLFDIHYVVWKTLTDNDKQEVFHALVDACPHKKVALSEGRITNGPCGSLLQCSYHGWTFDGENGKCIEIPQTVIAQRKRGDGPANADGFPNQRGKDATRRRQDAQSIAITEAQGMVWLHPSKSPLEALNVEGPPRIPELDMEGYKATLAVRDFPIDWTVLMENIMDPDHGYFAHSSSGSMALAFDWYASDGTENMINIDENFSSTGWKIQSNVNAVDKLIKYNKDVRMPKTGKMKDNTQRSLLVNKPKKNDPPKLATTTFFAPSVITLGRRDNETAASSFLTGFWIFPVGTGKSRFMSAAISMSPIAIPRWLVHMNLNNFLDQDTYLLVGQNRAVLKREAEGYISDAQKGVGSNVNNVRKSTYVYKSPSERMGVRIGQFFDATLSRVPNRKEALISWYNRNSNGNILFEDLPPREVVLDRYGQHTVICPDSMNVVKNCNRVIQSSKFVIAAMLFMKIMYERSTVPVLQAVQDTSTALSPISAPKQILTQLIARIVYLTAFRTLLTCRTICTILGIASISHWIATRIRREFFFKFDDALHRKDIKHIAKNWADV